MAASTDPGPVELQKALIARVRRMGGVDRIIAIAANCTVAQRVERGVARGAYDIGGDALSAHAGLQRFEVGRLIQLVYHRQAPPRLFPSARPRR